MAGFAAAGAPARSLSGPASQVSQLDGTYTFLKDSDGAVPSAGLKILLTFSNGSVVMVSDPPQPAYTDSGTYQFQSGVLQRLVLPRLGKFVSTGTVNLQNGVLTLPFKLLSGGAGQSEWKAPATSSADTMLDAVRKIAHNVRTRLDPNLDPTVKLQILAAISPGATRWQDFATVGTHLSLAGQVDEANWTFAQGVELKPDDPYLLNNFGHILGQEYDYEDAHAILLAARQLSPQNYYILANLGYTAYQLKNYDEAELVERAAVVGNPIPENYWSLCKILAAKHDARANQTCQQAQQLGIVGILQPGSSGDSGDEDQGKKPGGSGDSQPPPGDSQPPAPDSPPGPDNTAPDNRPDLKGPANNDDNGAESAPTVDPDSTIYSQIGKRNPALDQKKPDAYHYPPSQGEVNKEWAGHWEGYKVTGCIHRTRKFGQGLAMTLVHENICHYAQKLSLEVDKDGGITGKGEAVYVFYGKGDNPASMMLPLPMPPGGFFATFPGGYRVRKFDVGGQVLPDGSVYIGGRPEKEMYLLNVYEFQKIYGWNVFPPPVDHPGMPGELRISKQGTRWAMVGERTNKVSGMSYETTIFRSGSPFAMVKGCKILCPQSGVEKSVKPKCQLSAKADPVTISSDGKSVSASLSMKGGVAGEDGKVSTGINVEGGGETVGADLGMEAGGVNVGMTAEANYGKPGELQKAVNGENFAGCSSASPTVGTMKSGVTVGSKVAGNGANVGWSSSRNAVSGDETFSVGGTVSGSYAFGPGGGLKAGVSGDMRLIISSKCGLMTTFKVQASGKASVDADPAGGECSVTASMQSTQVWGQSNIAE